MEHFGRNIVIQEMVIKPPKQLEFHRLFQCPQFRKCECHANATSFDLVAAGVSRCEILLNNTAILYIKPDGHK